LKNFSRPCWASIALTFVLLLGSCAGNKPVMPSYEGQDFRSALSSMKRVSDIETRFSIVFEKNDSEIRGDGALDISNGGDMSLRIYSLGFLAMEMTSVDGVVKSSPRLDRNKTLILTQGLRDCLFWWDMKDFTLDEDTENFVLRNSERELWISKKSFLPVKQKLYFDDGRMLMVYYDEPAFENGSWYQSKIRIELARYSVKLNIKNMAFKQQS